MPQLTRIGAARKLRTRAAKNDCSLPMIAQLLIAIALTIGVSTAAAAEQRTIQVLWYTYSHPESHYRRMIERLGKVAHTLPKSAQIRWKISFYWPDWPQPRFERYGVLVIQSGEGFGSHSPKEAPLEKNDLVTIFGAGTRENQPSIPTAAQNHPLNAGLTSKGLSNWTNSFHAGFSHSLSGFFPFVNATRYPHMAVAIASERAPATR